MLISKEVLEEVTSIYKTISGDDNGFSYMKLPVALKALGLTMKDVDNALIKESMKSFSIDLTLFIRIVEDCWTKSNHMINEVNESFELFDRDKDEWLSAYDVMETFKKFKENLGFNDVGDQIREADVNNDSKLSVSEYQRMVLTTAGADFVFPDSNDQY